MPKGSRSWEQRDSYSWSTLPGPSRRTRNTHLSSPASGSCAWDGPAQLFGRVQHPEPEPPRVSRHPLDAGGAQGTEALTAIRCDPGCRFSGGDMPHKGPFVLSFPSPSCIVLPREGHNGALCRTEKGPCPSSSSLGSRLPLWVYPGWARPSERSSGSSCSALSSRTTLLGADCRGAVCLRGQNPRGSGRHGARKGWPVAQCLPASA